MFRAVPIRNVLAAVLSIVTWDLSASKLRAFALSSIQTSVTIDIAVKNVRYKAQVTTEYLMNSALS
jgi:hypothetical protein